MTRLNREYRTRAHIHHIIATEPGMIAICLVMQDDGSTSDQTLEREVPAWGVYDLIEDAYEDNVLKRQEVTRTRHAGPLVWVDDCGRGGLSIGLMPVNTVPGFLRIERNGVPITDRHHRQARVVYLDDVVFTDDVDHVVAGAANPRSGTAGTERVTLSEDPSRAILRYHGHHVVIDARIGAMDESIAHNTMRLIERLESINALLDKSTTPGQCGNGLYSVVMLRHVFVDSIYGAVSARCDWLHHGHSIGRPLSIGGIVDVPGEFSDGIPLKIVLKSIECDPGNDHFSRLHSDYYREWIRSSDRE
jgi:hypothetical protein